MLGLLDDEELGLAEGEIDSEGLADGKACGMVENDGWSEGAAIKK